jgi:glutathione S-transferase
MDLYYSPLACSLTARVVAAEADLPLSFRQVELHSKRLSDGGADGADASYFAVSPLGLVPALRLPDGSLLTEVTAVLQYLADQRPELGLAPPPGSPERYRVIQWLSYVGAELHKKILWTLFNPGPPAEAKAFARAIAPAAFDHLERHLRDREYLVGARFTIADAYLVWALQLARIAELDVRGGDATGPGRPALSAYLDRLRARPSVKAAFDLETPQARAAMQRQEPAAAAAR